MWIVIIYMLGFVASTIFFLFLEEGSVIEGEKPDYGEVFGAAIMWPLSLTYILVGAAVLTIYERYNKRSR